MMVCAEGMLRSGNSWIWAELPHKIHPAVKLELTKHKKQQQKFILASGAVKGSQWIENISDGFPFWHLEIRFPIF